MESLIDTDMTDFFCLPLKLNQSVYIMDYLYVMVYLAFRCPYWYNALFLLFV